MLIALLSCACATGADRAWVGRELSRRSGHGLAEPHTPGTIVWPNGVILDDGLDESEAVAIALWNSPTLESDLVQLKIARADVLEAAVPANPLLQMLFPGAGLNFGFTLYWAFDTLWQLPSRLKAARREQARAAESMVQRGLDLVRDVRLAHAETLLASDRVRLRREALALIERTRDLLAQQVRAGDLGDAEIAGIRGEAEAAREALRRAERDARVAEERLRLLLGIAGVGPTLELRPRADAPQPGPRLTLSFLLERALDARPDLRAAQLAIEAAGARVTWEGTKVVGITGMVDGGAGHARVGVRITPPVFDFNLGGIGRARARAQQTAWQYVVTRQRAIFELTEAHARLEQSWDSLAAYRANVLPALEENLRGAELLSKHGAQPVLVVVDALRRIVDARLQTVELEAEVRRAVAELDRSVGGKRQ